MGYMSPCDDVVVAVSELSFDAALYFLLTIYFIIYLDIIFKKNQR